MKERRKQTLAKLFRETERKLYYIESDGRVFNVLKSSVKDFSRTPPRTYLSTAFDHNGQKIVTVNTRVKGKKINYTYCVKNLVAKAFHPKYTENCYVLLRDGNQDNCDISNIVISSSKEFNKKNRVRIKVTKPNGEVIIYPSYNSAVRNLKVSVGGLSSHLRGVWHYRKLEGYKIERLR